MNGGLDHVLRLTNPDQFGVFPAGNRYLYVSSFGSYGALYGSIGAVLVLLMWMWLTNLAILLGAELNSELERERAIKAGMRPRDKTPFLPLRDSPP